MPGKAVNTVPADQSTRLWDFPEIKRYQVVTSRTDFWPQMERMKAEHAYESEPFQWPEPRPDTASQRTWVRRTSASLQDAPTTTFPAKFDWPQPQGSSSALPASDEGQYVKAGGLLRAGDIMPRTRPALFWSQSCSLYLCPLDTPHKERAYAWKYCSESQHLELN